VLSTIQGFTRLTRADRVVAGRPQSLRRHIIAIATVTESTALRAEFPLPHPSPAAIFKELDEGGVLLSTTDEVYFGVNPVGAQIWALLPPLSRTFGELCAALEQKYPDAGSERIRIDAQEFLEALIASGLVVAASS
jgi:hypothetical protein